MSEPAFPFTPTDRSGQIAETQPGMSLRDYFAIRALPLIAVGHSDPHATTVWVRPEYYAALASDAYVFADAMLKAREAKP